jgi:competence protein ComGC
MYIKKSPLLGKERGFTMALALAMVTVMGIFLMVAMPILATEVQREKEMNLIFRGEAIANALRLYNLRMGKYPTQLEELMKIKPRVIRQLYTDPMTEGTWEYIYAVQPGVSGSTEGLPIMGVRSRSERNSVVVYQKKSLIHDWAFTAIPNYIDPSESQGK